jgi:hypothetical protein
VFRRGSRREKAPPEKSSPGIDGQQPYWLAGVEEKPGHAGRGVAFFGDGQHHQAAEQQRWKGPPPSYPFRPSPLHGVPTHEVLEALSRPFSPPELDWELVGIAFVHPDPTPAEPDPELQVWLVEERPDGVLVEEEVGHVEVDEAGRESVVLNDDAPQLVIADEPTEVAPVEEVPAEPVAAEAAPESASALEPEPEVEEPFVPLVSAHALALASAGKRKRRKFREQEQVMAAVRELSWEGYCSLIADIFRREGYDVFVGEGADGDVIDMEVVRGDERMVVNCQLRGMSEIDVALVAEMTQVANRNGAEGAFLITDGSFAADAWSFSARQPVVLIDGHALLGLVLDFTLGMEREKRLSARLARLLRGPESKSRQKAS